MTIAEQTALATTQGRMSFNESFEESKRKGEVYEEDYENETTWIEFGDYSVASFCGATEEITTYGSK